MATVTVRDFASLEANTPPPRSIWLSNQPPKMSPFWLVSAGIASVRMHRSPQGSVSATGGAWTACVSVMSKQLIRNGFRLLETIPAGIRCEPAAEFRRQLPQGRRHIFDTARACVIQGTATERCIAGPENHGAIDHVGIVDDALAQAGDTNI